jgi:DNA-directed RNA polymerase subunit N (RpoN/RPB10)
MTTTQSQELLTRSDAAAYLKICRTTLDRLNIPRICIRRRVLFKKPILDKWLEENTKVREVVK